MKAPRQWASSSSYTLIMAASVAPSPPECRQEPNLEKIDGSEENCSSKQPETEPTSYARQTGRDGQRLNLRNVRANQKQAASICRTVAYEDANGISYDSNTSLQPCGSSSYDAVGLQETRRANDDGAFTRAGCVVVWSGTRAITRDEKGVHRVGSGVKQSMVDGIEKRRMTVECTGARQMKVRLQLTFERGTLFCSCQCPVEKDGTTVACVYVCLLSSL